MCLFLFLGQLTEPLCQPLHRQCCNNGTGVWGPRTESVPEGASPCTKQPLPPRGGRQRGAELQAQGRRSEGGWSSRDFASDVSDFSTETSGQLGGVRGSLQSRSPAAEETCGSSRKPAAPQTTTVERRRERHVCSEHGPEGSTPKKLEHQAGERGGRRSGLQPPDCAKDPGVHVPWAARETNPRHLRREGKIPETCASLAAVSWL